MASLSSLQLFQNPPSSHKKPLKTLKTITLSPSTLSFPTLFSHPQNPKPLFASSTQDSYSSFPIQEIVERDWSFVDTDTLNSQSQLSHKTSQIIAAARLGPGSRVLASHASPHFVKRLVGVSSATPFHLLLSIHESLLSLALIKEQFDDRVRCWQGPIVDIPSKWAPFTAVFLCYLPALGLPIGRILAALALRCSPGSRVVISYAQGRETIQRHLQQYPDMVTSNLPDKDTLQKVSAEHLFQLIDIVDEPTFYLAVLEFSK